MSGRVNYINIIILLIVIVLLVYYDLINHFKNHIQYSILNSLNHQNDDIKCKITNQPSKLIHIYGNQAINQFEWKEIDKSDNNLVNQLFNLAVLHIYGYNKYEALRLLNSAILLDDKCIKCYWAVAYAHGPDINSGINKHEVISANNSLYKAFELISKNNNKVSNYLNDLLTSQRLRFAYDINDWERLGQSYYDKLYSNRMNELIFKYPNDSNILTLHAESIVNIYPWKYYNTTSHELLPSLLPAYQSLKKALDINFKNPLALHLFIHITESSDHPSDGESAADSLAQLVGSDGSSHLNHMPAHTFIRLGRYQSAIESSIKAVDLDSHYKRNCLTSYLPNHNLALLVMSAMSIGRLNLALKYTLTVSETDDAASIYLSGLFPTSKELLYSRFGQWKSILVIHNHFVNSLIRSKQSDRSLRNNELIDKPVYLQVIHQYAVTLAHIRLNRVETISSLDLLSQLVSTIPQDNVPDDHIFYPYHQQLGVIMNLTAYASYLLLIRDINQSIDLLDQAVYIQQSFKYMEPENHYLPIRQCLGAVHLMNGNPSKAIDTYINDLIEHPSNGWSLKGLSIAKKKLNNHSTNYSIKDENDMIYSREEWYNHPSSYIDSLFNRVWSKADINIKGSCCELGLC